MANSKNHHFLPQFYLRGFRSSGTSKKSQKVWSFSKARPVQCSEEFIKDVGCEEDFHTVTKCDGTVDSDSIEEHLAKLENIYAPVRDKLVSGAAIDATERHLLSQFVCVMENRTSAAKASIDRGRSGRKC